MHYGYARVSTRDQNVDRQLDALRAFPVEDQRIYVDYYTGATFERPRYRRLVRRLREGDLVVVTSIDRLGRNYEEIIEQWRRLTRAARGHRGARYAAARYAGPHKWRG